MSEINHRRIVPERVRRVQELRRSSATTPRDRRRPARPTARRLALREQGAS